MSRLFAVAALMMVVAGSGVATIAQEKGKPRPKSLTGQVSKIDAASVTVTQRGDSGVRSTTFSVGAGTKIMIQTDEDQVLKTGEGERKVPKTREAKLADVKVEQRVTVSYVEDGKADSILVLRAPKVRKGEGK